MGLGSLMGFPKPVFRKFAHFLLWVPGPGSRRSVSFVFFLGGGGGGSSGCGMPTQDSFQNPTASMRARSKWRVLFRFPALKARA